MHCDKAEPKKMAHQKNILYNSKIGKPNGLHIPNFQSFHLLQHI